MYEEQKTLKLMGNAFEFTAIHDSRELCVYAIDKAILEVQRIESFLSTYKADSEVNAINNNAGKKPIKVSIELYHLIQRCVRISNMTQGTFDITYGGVDKSLWNFDTAMTKLPSHEIAQKSVALVNYRNIGFDDINHYIYLKNEGMRIGFGGIGKGYAADQAKKIMISLGIKSGAVNAAGDLNVWGKPINNDKWVVGVANPLDKNNYFSKIKIDEGAVATSGTYEKFVIIDGTRYSHTIDPRTGLPSSGIQSVTVISPIAELADALTTPLAILGVEIGLHLINQIKDVACIIVDDHNIIHTSKNISKFQ